MAAIHSKDTPRHPETDPFRPSLAGAIGDSKPMQIRGMRRQLAPLALISARLTVVLLAVLPACFYEPVEWSDISYRHSQLGAPPARSAVFSGDLPSVAGTAGACTRGFPTVASHS